MDQKRRTHPLELGALKWAAEGRSVAEVARSLAASR